MPLTQDEIFSKVQESLIDALGVDDDEVTAEATLVGDLGAESIDEDIVDEPSSRCLGSSLIKLDHVHDIDADRFEQLQLARQPRQELGRRLGTHHGRWMNIEGNDRCAHPTITGAS